MTKNEFAEYSSETKDQIFVYWKSLQEVASAIHAWADKTGRIGSVETVLDLTDDSANRKEIFYKMPVEIVLRGCAKL